MKQGVAASAGDRLAILTAMKGCARQHCGQLRARRVATPLATRARCAATPMQPKTPHLPRVGANLRQEVPAAEATLRRRLVTPARPWQATTSTLRVGLVTAGV